MKRVHNVLRSIVSLVFFLVVVVLSFTVCLAVSLPQGILLNYGESGGASAATMGDFSLAQFIALKYVKHELFDVDILEFLLNSYNLESGFFPIGGLVDFNTFMANTCTRELFAVVRFGVQVGILKDSVEDFRKLLEVLAPSLVSSALNCFLGLFTLFGHPSVCDGVDPMAVPPLQVVAPVVDDSVVDASVDGIVPSHVLFSIFPVWKRI
ncbi:hypothetical protein SUGI_0365440 [Cryptomeria japonica]|nr:hypothetical protein SUGI_0365440 [Cryptomeria japonica]